MNTCFKTVVFLSTIAVPLAAGSVARAQTMISAIVRILAHPNQIIEILRTWTF